MRPRMGGSRISIWGTQWGQGQGHGVQVIEVK